MKAERERLEAEREDNRRMMQELLELKAALAKKESDTSLQKDPSPEESNEKNPEN